MNDYIDISTLQAMGAQGPSANKPKSLGSGDLVGFLNQLAAHLKSNEITDSTDTTLQKVPNDIKALAEKISAALKDNDALPPELANLSPDKLVAQIAQLLQEKNIVASSLAEFTPDELGDKISGLLQELQGTNDQIKPSLLRDLASNFAAQVNDEDAAKNITESTDKNVNLVSQLASALENNSDDLNKHISLSEITEGLSQINSDSESAKAAKDSIIKELLAKLQAQGINMPASADNPLDTSSTSGLKADILQKLQEDLSQLELLNGEIKPEDIATLKKDIIAALQAQGLNSSEIEEQLAVLAQNLKNGLKPEFTEKNSLSAEMQNKGKKDTLLSQVSTLTTDLKTADSQNTEKSDSDKQAQTAQNHATKNNLEKQNLTSGKQEQIISSLLQNNENKTAAQTNLSAKIAGISLNPQMVSSVAGSDGQFSSDMMMNGGQQHLSESAALLKPETVDGLRNQSFTNYLHSARGTSHATTEMINLQLKHNINSRISSMTLQLTPSDLGTLDIKLKFHSDGSVKAHLSVEKPETLAMLQKDSAQLEKILQQTGLNTDENSLSFDLKQNQHNRQNLEGYNDGNNHQNNEFAAHMDGTAADEILKAQVAIEAMGYISQTGVNIRV